MLEAWESTALHRRVVIAKEVGQVETNCKDMLASLAFLLEKGVSKFPIDDGKFPGPQHMLNSVSVENVPWTFNTLLREENHPKVHSKFNPSAFSILSNHWSVCLNHSNHYSIMELKKHFETWHSQDTSTALYTECI